MFYMLFSITVHIFYKIPQTQLAGLLLCKDVSVFQDVPSSGTCPDLLQTCPKCSNVENTQCFSMISSSNVEKHNVFNDFTSTIKKTQCFFYDFTSNIKNTLCV